jgi:hypothetical protein
MDVLSWNLIAVGFLSFALSVKGSLGVVAL